MDESKSSGHIEEQCVVCVFKTLRAQSEQLDISSLTDTIDAEPKNKLVLDEETMLRELEIHHHMIAQSISELEQTRRELHHTEQRYVSLFAFSPAALLICDASGQVYEANAAFFSLLERSNSGLVNIGDLQHYNLSDFFVPEDRTIIQLAQSEALHHTLTPSHTLRFKGTGNSVRWVRIGLQKFEEHNSQFNIIASLTDLHHEQEQIEQGETLLRELNHRIKNSLGLILSILNLERSHGSVKIDLNGVINRVHSLSRVYDRLYQKSFVSHIDFAPYITELCQDLVHGFAGGQHMLNVTVDCPPRTMDAKNSMYIGLMITELWTNALHYSFPDGFRGDLNCSVHEDEPGMLVIYISSNGQAGLPAGFDLATQSGTGLQLVQHLCTQLKGTLSLITGIPCTFTIVLPLPACT